jgi:diguanylate cyclase (GGDEF)-like protein
VFVVDAEEDGSPDKNNLGDEFFLDHNLQCILTGRHVDSLVFFADEFGVWLTTAVPLCDRNGVIVAAVAVDVPALDGVEIPGNLVRGPSRVVDAATVRLTRAEIDSITDGLTGLYNHRYIHERLAEELARASREHTELSLLFCDLDNFKQFNDRFGHSAGDRALRTVAGIILGCVRSIDLVGRYGGEEFTVVLPEIDSRGTLEVAERIRAAVENTQALSEGGSLTVSIGVARYPTDAANKEELIDRADWSMYRAKRAGRNQVVPFVLPD